MIKALNQYGKRMCKKQDAAFEGRVMCYEGDRFQSKSIIRLVIRGKGLKRGGNH